MNRRPAGADSCLARPLCALLARSTLTFATVLMLTSAAQAADLVIDNGGPGFSVIGDWPVSTAVAGFQGANYQTHIANGPVPGALTVDNTDAGFSVTGDWPVSTAVAGHLGANYRTHAANGPRPGSLVIDNTSGTALGTWSVSTAVAGYQGSNYQTHAAGSGTDSFTWPLAGSGHYRVYARWTSHANRAGNARYTVSHSSGDTEISVNQKQNGGSWQLLGTFELAADSHITLSDAADGYVIADAVMAEPANAQPSAASWELPVSLAGNYRLYARWSAHPNRASNARYRITHTGGDSEVSVNQQQNGGSWQLLGTYALASGQARVALTDEANGYVIADAVMAVPDTAPAANRATWTPTLAQASRYDVYAKWTAHPNRASDARYTISHSGGTAEISVNQQQNGGTWQLLGQFDLAPGQAAVHLTDTANGYVIADAVRLTSVGPVQASLYFIHSDHLGTPRLVTDEQSNVVWRHLPTTEPFGNSPPKEDPNATGKRFEMNLAFPGQYRDRESGLSYNYFRDYDPAIGAYRQSDPIGLAGGINTYGYVNGNPVSYVDPDGLQQRAPPPRPNPNLISNLQANSLINQIQQINPQFRYPSVVSAPGQGGYSSQDVQFLQTALQRARTGSALWPRTPQEMDQYLGTTGICRSDLPGTAGRSKIVWQPSDNVRITYEQHPYHPTAPAFHSGPHWHLDLPGVRHQTFVPTEPMP